MLDFMKIKQCRFINNHRQINNLMSATTLVYLLIRIPSKA
jgi:hypothetical protein